MPTFAIARVDGRSNADVLLEYVQAGEPGQVYTYAELIAALSAGSPRAFDVAAVRGVVTQSLKRMLRVQQRTLQNVRGIGYRLACANDHGRLALARKRRGDTQYRLSLLTLQQVRWDEMDPQARKAHEGTLMLVGSLYQQQQALERRLSAVEAAVKKLA